MSASGQHIVVRVNGQEFLVEIGDLDRSPVIAVVDGHTYEVYLEEDANRLKTKPISTAGKAQPENTLRSTDQEQVEVASSTLSGVSVISPLPGDIVDVKVQPGQQVNKGDSLCVIDAMKMKNVIRSPHDGIIASVEVSIGQLVDYGDVLITYK